MIKLIFFMVDKETYPDLEKVVSHYTNDELFEFVHAGLDEADDLLKNIEGSAILFFKVNDRDSLTASLKILKNHFKQIRTGFIKTACFLELENKKVEKALAKLGCREFLNKSIAERSLKFKIDFWSKALINQMKKAQQTEMVVKSNSENKNNHKKNNNDFEFKTIDPLNTNEDIWLNSRNNLCKRVLRSTMVRLVGPCQGAVYWKEEKRLDSGDQVYSLVYANDEVKNHIYQDDVKVKWLYHGSKPEYDWDSDEWLFTGQKPKLYYQLDGEEFIRFNFDESGKYITGTSPLSNRKLPVYFDLKKNAHTFANKNSSESKTDTIESDEDKKLENLKGKGRTEKIDRGNLEGKSSTDEIENGNLEGRSNTDQLGGNLEGKASTDRSNGNLEGKAGTDDLGGNLEGKASTDRSNGNLEGKASTDDLGGNLEGKASTDRSNGNLEGKASTDDLGGNLEGKASTDRSSGNLEGKAGTDDLGGNLQGKGRTSSINKKPLTGKDHTKEFNDMLEGAGAEMKAEDEQNNAEGLIFSPHEKKKTKKTEEPLVQQTPGEDFEEMTEAPSVVISMSFQVDNLVKTFEATLVEWDEEEFCVISSEFDVETIDLMTIFIDIKYSTESYKFKLKGKINGLTPSDNGDVVYYFTLDSDYEQERNQFIDIYAQRQNHINRFMKLAKGQ